MFCKSFCSTIIGVNAYVVQVEADVSEGLPVINLVGMLNSEVKESKERVRSAIRNLGLRIPPKRITLNLSPADIRKEGSAFDLSIAFALMGALEYAVHDRYQDIMFVGELSLDGHINRVNGVLPMVIAAKEQGFKYCMVPYDNVSEGTIVEGIGIIGVSTLEEALIIINEGMPEAHVATVQSWNPTESNIIYKNFSDVSGQYIVKRAAEIAAAGSHNLLMIGPPGSGKTMIAERIPGILPTMTMQESIEVSRIYSICGELNNMKGYIYNRPFRSPHHSIPRTGLVGGGNSPMPGEISLAHKGVLFLDELTEFPRNIIELLRQPLENKGIIHARSNTTIRYPADFMLVAAMNPCPCGNYPDKKKCTCTPMQIKRYIGKLSNAFIDRIDLVVDVQPVEYSQLYRDEKAESSELIRERVEAALEIQHIRYKGTDINNNAALDAAGIKKWCMLDEADRGYLKNVFERLGMSARAYHKVIKVARTIADLDGSRYIERKHLSEAVFYRTMDQKYKLMEGGSV